MKYHAGDLLGMAFESGQDLLSTLIKDNNVFICPTWRRSKRQKKNESQDPCAKEGLSVLKSMQRTRGLRLPCSCHPSPWPVGPGPDSPVRILLVSEGQRSRARIPGMLALCSPFADRITQNPVTAKSRQAREPHSSCTPPFPTPSYSSPAKEQEWILSLVHLAWLAAWMQQLPHCMARHHARDLSSVSPCSSYWPTLP